MHWLKLVNTMMDKILEVFSPDSDSKNTYLLKEPVPSHEKRNSIYKYHSDKLLGISTGVKQKSVAGIVGNGG